MSGKRLNVAVVDDDPGLCKAVGRLLSAAGIESTTYTSAEAFLEARAKYRPDCLLLDIQLGGMSGFDLQKRLVTEGEAPPIVFLTAGDEPEAREQAQRFGCAAYLLKTVPACELLEAIQDAVAAGKGAAPALEPLTCK
jgi:FixJ family two-component response regulator